MLSVLQSSVDPGIISATGAVVVLGSLAVTLLWLRVFYRSSGI